MNSEILLDKARELISSADLDQQLDGVSIIEDLVNHDCGEAIYALATWHIHGVFGKERDITRAHALLTKAAIDHHVKEAFFDLAIYEWRHSKDKSRYKRSFGYMVVSATLGDSRARSELPRYFGEGVGTFKCEEIAVILESILEAERPQEI